MIAGKGLSASMIQDLYGKKGSSVTSSSWWMDYGGTIYAGKPPAESVGKFEGKSGTLVRSRSGNTRRNLNGRRSYMPGSVLAYKV